MRSPHDFLSTAPFDVYELHLFHLVASSGSFTKAGQLAGLTQSAITRQIQGIENRVETRLFERTTRRVQLTDAGQYLFDRAESILRDVDRTLKDLRENFANAPKTISVGVSRSIGLAYLPGFFFAFRRKHPDIHTQVTQRSSQDILAAIERNEMQVGVLCPPKRLPSGIKITHRFDDEFTIIAPPDAQLPASVSNTRKLLQKLKQEDWLLLDQKSNTGKRLHSWLTDLNIDIKASMEADTFDLIINLVTMGMGYSIVPHRALPLYPRTRAIQRIPLRPKFARELVVVIRKDRKPPSHLVDFIESILF